MAAISGSALPIRVEIVGVDVTEARITMVFAWAFGLKPILVKSTDNGEISVTYDNAQDMSVLRLVLSAEETRNLTGDVVYTIYVDDGSPGGPWVPDNGGVGVIKFQESVAMQ